MAYNSTRTTRNSLNKPTPYDLNSYSGRTTKFSRGRRNATPYDVGTYGGIGKRRVDLEDNHKIIPNNKSNESPYNIGEYGGLLSQNLSDINRFKHLGPYNLSAVAVKNRQKQTPNEDSLERRLE